MIYSMTGFGRGENESELYRFVVEVKSVNHRYNDIIIKMPKKLNILEEKMKSKIKERVTRGRVEVFVNFSEDKGEEFKISPNFSILDQYHDALVQIKDRYNINEKVSLGLLSKFPDALDIEYKEADADVLWSVMEGAMDKALDSLVNMREAEGKKLADDVIGRIDAIKSSIREIEKLTPDIIETHKKKMIERIEELLGETIELDEARIAHEVAVFADKTNITEEIVRLYSHFDQLGNILESNGSVGRKLDFLIQELNREVNTIGSKSPDIDISSYVVEMKSEIEKIREQIQNIE